ncbi:MAG: glycosyltransferase [Defluviitaleaceae bacterium]|nr:glycosyltransferase [Defluviitaleaceae bacterium]
MSVGKLLSVIVPLFNVQDYVQKAAESLSSQAFDGLEIVAVDDGSTDDSLAVFLENLSGINAAIIRQENAGLSAARNAGINAATGQYILFLDSDDYLLPNAIKNICGLLTSQQPDIIYGRFLRWNPQKGFWGCKPYEWQPPSDRKRRTEYILDGLPEHSWNAFRYICRRDFILENNLFFEHGLLCEDVPWTLELLEKAEAIAFLPEPFYAYFIRRPNSIMNTKNPKRLLDLNDIVYKLLQKYSDRPPICRQLINLSFLQINEYCEFDKKYQKLIYQSYKKLLPLYRLSAKKIHKISSICNNALLFYLQSLALYIVKLVVRKIRE